MSKSFIILSTFIFIGYSSFSQEINKCDINTLKDFKNSLENLTFESTKSFILTFDSSCSNNVEYSEWSNELIFLLITKDINMLSEVLHHLGWKYVQIITNEIENPVLDVDIQKMYDNIKVMNGPKDMKVVFEESIKIAANKSGIILK